MKRIFKRRWNKSTNADRPLRNQLSYQRDWYGAHGWDNKALASQTPYQQFKNKFRESQNRAMNDICRLVLRRLKPTFSVKSLWAYLYHPLS